MGWVSSRSSVGLPAECFRVGRLSFGSDPLGQLGLGAVLGLALAGATLGAALEAAGLADAGAVLSDGAALPDGAALAAAEALGDGAVHCGSGFVLSPHCW